MKKKTIEIPLLPRAKYMEVDDNNYDEYNEAIKKQTMIFLQAYSDHVTVGNPALGLTNFIYHASTVWREEIRDEALGVCHDPWVDFDFDNSDLEDGSTKEAKAFKAKARKLINGEYKKVIPIQPMIKIKDMS
jgi:hypothetical protein